MSDWNVTTERRPGTVWMEIVGAPADDDMRELVAAHNAAIDSFAGAPYHVFVDLHAMKVLSAEAAEILEQAKVYSSAQPNFRGSAVLVASQVVGMQHRRTSIAGGVMETELIGTDEALLLEHLDSLPL